ncbi:MAG: hypothetical protein ACRDRJ_04740 [Streptosporangiaceae bacterium]
MPSSIVGVVCIAYDVVMDHAVVSFETFAGPMTCSPGTSLVLPMSCPAVGHDMPPLAGIAPPFPAFIMLASAILNQPSMLTITAAINKYLVSLGLMAGPPVIGRPSDSPAQLFPSLAAGSTVGDEMTTANGVLRQEWRRLFDPAISLDFGEKAR